ncbi:hypothetical protein GF324_06375, partial [bacterium]|nr:hypothetical protein [bacterium]
MHGYRKLLPALLFLFVSLHVSTSAVALEHTTDRSIQWTVESSGLSGLAANLQLDRVLLVEDEIGPRLDLEGAAYSETDPFPRVSTLVWAPNGVDVRASVQNAGSFENTGLVERESIGLEPSVQIGEPALFRGIRVFPLSISPVAVDEEGYVRIATNLQLDVNFEGSNNLASGRTEPIRVSADLRRLLEGRILNLDEVDLVEVAPVGRLLVLMPNSTSISNAVNPYVLWKIQQGYDVTVQMITSTNNPTLIRSEILSEYNSTDEVPLEYVLLIGDASGSISMANSEYESDHGYGCLEGDDILADVAVGRFSVNDLTTLHRVVNKTLAYERDVFMINTDWLERGALAAGSGSGTSPIQTNRAILNMMAQNDIDADSMWWTMPGGNNAIPDFLIDEINSGVHYVNYRGYYGMSGWNNSDVDQLTNASRLPVFVTITCGTGTWVSQSTALSEGIFRGGSGYNTFRGGVASIGTATTSTHTRFNNVVDGGIFEAPFMQGVRSLGWALVNGKMRLYEAYHATSESYQVENFSEWNNLMGDPALRMWVNVPQEPDVTHPSTFSNGTNFIDVEVDLPGEQPELIWASLSSGNSLIDTRRFHSDGHVRLYLEDPASYDDIKLTVTGDNVVPYQEDISRFTSGSYIGYDSADLDDENGDGDITPAETVDITLTVRNTGTVASNTVSATVSSDDPRLTIVSGGTFTIPGRNPDATYTRTSPIVVEIANWTPDGTDLSATLTVSNGGEDQVSAIPIPVSAWTGTKGGDIAVDDGDDIFDP